MFLRIQDPEIPLFSRSACLQRLRAKTKIRKQLVRELLFADDCGIFAHSVEDLQSLMDSFANASIDDVLT